MGKVQVANQRGGAEVEEFARKEQLRQRLLAHLSGAIGRDIDTHRLGHSNGVGHLDFALIGQPRRDNLLGRVARVVGRRAIDLRGILPRKGPAAVRAHAAVGIHDNLAPGHPRVPGRTANHKAPGGVQVEGCPICQQPRGREHLANDRLETRVDGLFAHLPRLVRADHRGNLLGLAALIKHRDLRLGVRP